MTDDERLDDFERWVRIGLGRALQWIDSNGDEAYREFLSEICVVETAYDQQIEGSRAAYAAIMSSGKDGVPLIVLRGGRRIGLTVDFTPLFKSGDKSSLGGNVEPVARPE